ncbi:MAG TPA: GNAT family N-acetyltransferase [Burkholderiales bacterium]|nr:GNAT family N-acetyltransferase [Burkholderiales bacterium]
MVRVRPYAHADLDAAAGIHAEAFARQQHSTEWIASNARAHPRVRLYVAELDAAVRGFILWTERSGFRSEVVLELEQIAVAAKYRRLGIGEALIRGSLPDVANQLAGRSANLKAVIVSTRADSAAQRLYRKTLGAEVEAQLSSLYSADEVLMVARKPL